MNLKNASLKQKLVLILGIAYILLHAGMEAESIGYGAPLSYISSPNFSSTALRQSP